MLMLRTSGHQVACRGDNPWDRGSAGHSSGAGDHHRLHAGQLGLCRTGFPPPVPPPLPPLFTTTTTTPRMRLLRYAAQFFLLFSTSIGMQPCGPRKINGKLDSPHIDPRSEVSRPCSQLTPPPEASGRAGC